MSIPYVSRLAAPSLPAIVMITALTGSPVELRAEEVSKHVEFTANFGPTDPNPVVSGSFGFTYDTSVGSATISPDYVNFSLNGVQYDTSSAEIIYVEGLSRIWFGGSTAGADGIISGPASHVADDFVLHVYDFPQSSRFQQFNYSIVGVAAIHSTTAGSLTVYDSPALVCDGFYAPMNGVVTVRNNRALPLKAQIFDANGFVVTGADIDAAPVINVAFTPDIAQDPVDVTDEITTVGRGTIGNQFVYDDLSKEWRFNLGTRNYTAAGTYTITILSGNNAEYSLKPECSADFVLSD